MVRKVILGAAALAATLAQTAGAAERVVYGEHPAMAVVSQMAPVKQAGHGQVIATNVQTHPAGYNGGAYPKLNAPLYPSPVQSTQPWSGGSIITNQAFAPHEMLYPHKYHAMYPPFYYQVKGSWIWTPFGMRQHERWKLQGTEVKVNYRSTYAPFSGFHPKFALCK
jgi:hypothetical protein